jgi:riboflavin biosynthesis pyrimidine reductase
MTPDDRDLERLYARPAVDRPWVRMNFVSTLDGAAATADGTSGALGGAPDARVFRLLRSLADVIVVGAGTARAEGYSPVDPAALDGDLRVRLGLPAVPPLAVVSGRLDVPAALVAPGQLVITTDDAPADRLAALRGSVDVVTAGTGTIDWTAVLHELGRRGLRHVLCEGGPSLHGDLVAADLVDEVCLTYAPVLSGGDAPRIAHGPVAHDRPMRLGHVVDADGVLLTRWVRDRS